MKTLLKNLEPRVGAVYGYGWNIMKMYFLPLFLLLLITGIISLPVGLFNEPIQLNSNQFNSFIEWQSVMRYTLIHNSTEILLLKIFAIAYTLFIINPIDYGAKYVRLKAIRHEKFDVKEVFDAFKNYLNVVLAALLASSIVIIGLIFLIIPGIIFACRLVFVPYLVMDKKLDPVKAVEESWRLTKGYGWRIFWMAILAFFVGIAGLLCLFIGIVFSIIWVSSAFAALYQAVIQEKGEYVSVNDEIEATI